METYEDRLYNIIEDACRQCELSIGHNNTIEIDPGTKMLDKHVDQIMEVMDDYRRDKLITTCKELGLRDLCEHCENRFSCWTER